MRKLIIIEKSKRLKDGYYIFQVFDPKTDEEIFYRYPRGGNFHDGFFFTVYKKNELMIGHYKDVNVVIHGK